MYTDPTGHWSWKKFWHSAVGALVGVVLTAVLGPAGLGMSMAMAGMIGGMAGGAITGGLDGGARGALLGAAMGGILGGVGGWAAGLKSPVGNMILGGMMAGGIGYAAVTDSWDSLAGGIVGGLAGAVVGGSILKGYSQQFANYRAGNGFVDNATAARINSMKVLGQINKALAMERQIQSSAVKNSGTFQLDGSPYEMFNDMAEIYRDINFTKDFAALRVQIADTMKVGSGDYFIFTTDPYSGHIVPPGALRVSAGPYDLYGLEKQGLGLRGPFYIFGTNRDTSTYLKNNELYWQAQ